MEGKGGGSPNDHEKVRTRLPPGFRFDPTDQELVLYYLKPKVLSLPLPATDVIPEICLKKYDPWDLPGAGQGERYFFTMLEANYRRNRSMYRLTSSGYWKVTSKSRPVTINSDQCNQPIAIKRVLTFYIGRPTRGSRTNWMMHEYCLIESNMIMGVHQKRNTINDCNSEPTYWAVCRIFEKNKQHKKLDLETIRSSSSRDRVLSEDSRLRRPASFQSDQVSTVSLSSCITCSSDDQVEQGSTCTSNPLYKSFN